MHGPQNAPLKLLQVHHQTIQRHCNTGSPGARSHLCEVFSLWHQDVPSVVLNEIQRLVNCLQHLRQWVCRPACVHKPTRQIQWYIIMECQAEHVVIAASGEVETMDADLARPCLSTGSARSQSDSHSAPSYARHHPGCHGSPVPSPDVFTTCKLLIAMHYPRVRPQCTYAGCHISINNISNHGCTSVQ